MNSRFIVVVILTLTLFGCSAGRVCDCLPLNEPGAIPDENGVTVNQWLCRQTENAQHNKSIIYQADWVGATDRLSPFGRKRLGSWSNLSGVQPPLYVESSGDSFLDSQRQAAISSYLVQAGVDIPSVSVQLVYADEHLEGEEVPAIADRFLGEQIGTTETDSGFPQSGQPGGFF